MHNASEPVNLNLTPLEVVFCITASLTRECPTTSVNKQPMTSQIRFFPYSFCIYRRTDAKICSSSNSDINEERASIVPVMDDIWNFIEEKLNTPVPHYFKTVLSVCGYSNGISISLIGDEDLQYIEKEVKNGNVEKALNGVEDYLKGCTKNAANFEFVLGHRKFLLAIAGYLSKYIAENGAESISSTDKHSDIKKKNKRGPPTQPSKGTREKKPVLPSRKRVGKNDPRVKPLVEYAMSTKLHLQQRSSTVPPEVLQEHRQVLLERMIGCLIRLTPKLFKEVGQNACLMFTCILILRFRSAFRINQKQNFG